jgi:hypothetical protein
VGREDYEGDQGKRGENFLGLLKKYRVEFFCNGHTHSYERGLLDGTYHILSGGGGAGEEEWGRAWDHVAVFALTRQYCTFSFLPQQAVMECRDGNDSLVDRLVVQKGKPQSLDAAPVPVDELRRRPAPGDSLTFRVKVPALGAKKMRYRISYDRTVDTYRWTPAIPAFQDAVLSIRPARSGTYSVVIVGMDEDGRLTRPLTQKIEYAAP